MSLESGAVCVPIELNVLDEQVARLHPVLDENVDPLSVGHGVC